MTGLVGALVSLGCRDLTNVGSNGLVQPSQFDNATGAVVRSNQAVALFATAQSEQVAWSGLVADELIAYSQLIEPVDALHITTTNAVGTYPYADLTNARLNGLRAIASLQRYAPYPPSRIGRLFAFVGLVELYFAEDMCSGVPLAGVVDGLPTGSVVLSRDSLTARAIAHFDSAVAYAVDSGTVNTQLVGFARVAKARALVDAGKVAEAAATVTDVPGSFVYLNNEFSNSQANAVNGEIYVFGFMSVANREGGNGLDFVSGADPRVPIVVAQVQNGVDTLYAFAPYATDTGSIVLGSGTEASLIRAEAALQAGQVTAWGDTLNALRAAFPDTALSHHPLPPDSTIAASSTLQQDVMFRERAFWLFLSGHRQGDLRRLVRQYNRPVGAVFPTGVYPRLGGTVYGTDVTYVPVGEANNPAFHGCVDRLP